jgi:hypothetical protein
VNESTVASQVRLALQPLGTTLFRNTVGRFQVVDLYGGTRYVQAGLCVGSSDFIGFTEKIIQPHEVGRRVAIFTAIETKNSKGGRRTDVQTTFIDRVIVAGGIAGFANSAGRAIEVVTAWGDK